MTKENDKFEGTSVCAMLPTPQFYLLVNFSGRERLIHRTPAYVKNRVSVHCEAENFVFFTKTRYCILFFFLSAQFYLGYLW